LLYTKHVTSRIEHRVMDIFRPKSWILVVLRRFLSKIRVELNNEFRITNIELKMGENKTFSPRTYPGVRCNGHSGDSTNIENPLQIVQKIENEPNVKIGNLV
jgi:hypothetical protein